jgi:thiol:disulfide interchange protein
MHGAAIKLFGAWRATGYALSAVSVVLLLVAVYFLSRRLGAARWLAIAASLAVLAGTSAQDALLTIREDAMAAMLNIWGLATCAGEDLGRRQVYLRPLCSHSPSRSRRRQFLVRPRCSYTSS